MCPRIGVFYVANADHKNPAADRPYAKLDLNELIKTRIVLQHDRLHSSTPISIGARYHARDTLSPPRETNSDAVACLNGLCWEPASFDVWLDGVDDKHGDLLVRFPSAVRGQATNDVVAMEWYQARDKEKRPVVAPAAVIVHESGSGMTVGRLIANGLRQKGIHAFMIQLPHYGKRKGPDVSRSGDQLMLAMKQGIADVRRAKDAVAMIPLVDPERISLQGTSLGGFVTATTAGLDPAYHRVFILLAGGDLHGVMMQGKKDAAKMRQAFQQGGMTENELKQLLDTVEPLRLAHRLVPEKTWIFSGKYDDVVPLKKLQSTCKGGLPGRRSSYYDARRSLFGSDLPTHHHPADSRSYDRGPFPKELADLEFRSGVGLETLMQSKNLCPRL